MIYGIASELGEISVEMLFKLVPKMGNVCMIRMRPETYAYTD